MKEFQGHDPDLGDFLDALRVNQIPVGHAEIQRIRHLFSLQPSLDRDGLKQLLRSLLIKKDNELERFESLFNEWCPERLIDRPIKQDPSGPVPEVGSLEHHPHTPTQITKDSTPDTSPSTPYKKTFQRQRRLWKPLTVVAAVIIGLCALLFLWFSNRKEPVSTLTEQSPIRVEEKAPTENPNKSASPLELPSEPAPKVWVWQATIEVEPYSGSPKIGKGMLALVGCVALVTFAGIGHRYRRRFQKIAAESRTYFGPNWQPLPPPIRDDTALVPARDRRQMVWNIEHFVTSDLTQRLDAQRTVTATARSGGFVELRYQPMAYQRQIWFWLDNQLDQSVPQHLVDEMQTTLTAAGLEVHQGRFTDVPDRVDWSVSPAYRPALEEGKGRQAMVTIFTTGEGLEHQLHHGLHRLHTDSLLRGLRLWPRLCFVDCSSSQNRLKSLLAPYGIETIALNAVPEWLGGTRTRQPAVSGATTEVHGDTRIWAAAVALGGIQATTADAHTLRIHLDLEVEAWRVDSVMDLAGYEHRNWLINWFLRCEPRSANGRLTPGGLVLRSVEWWRQRFADAAVQNRENENPLHLWSQSLAARRWKLERTLLLLLNDPEKTARDLAKLADDDLKEEIRERLGDFSAGDWLSSNQGDYDERIYCPWKFRTLSVMTRYHLRKFGFNVGREGESSNSPKLQKSPRLLLSVTALICCAVSAFLVASFRGVTSSPPVFVADNPYDTPAFEQQTIRMVKPVGDDVYQVAVGSARSLTVKNVRAGIDVPLSWSWAPMDTVIVKEEGKSVILRAGRLPQPIRACGEDWPERSFAVIAADYNNADARRLAIRVLDKGSADQVLVSLDWPRYLEEWLGENRKLNEATQLLIITKDKNQDDPRELSALNHPGPWAVVTTVDWLRCAGEWKFPGIRKASDWPDILTVLETNGDVYIYGGPEQTPPDPETGIEWITVCPGTFTMGSDKSELEEGMAYKNEIPDKENNTPRVVIMPKFQMAATEITRDQYGRVVADYRESGRKPVDSITWQEALDYCEYKKVDGTLPTEAQWEYAARGGSRSRWSHGDDVEILDAYAWYRNNSEGRTHEVGITAPNPLGLYDMHGNLWEWAKDYYGDYQSGVFMNSAGPATGNYRVLRGGSYLSTPRVLRSALRFFFGPEGRNWRDGFRCVRLPPQFD